jgi:four helix bundle protein
LLLVGFRLMAISESSAAVHPADQLEQRLVEFAVRVLALCNTLGGSYAGKHIASQLVRSGTSPAPNYSEARSAESRADFIHKLRIVVKELNETSVWLVILARGGFVVSDTLSDIIAECTALKRIIGASLRTARANAPAARRAERIEIAQ